MAPPPTLELNFNEFHLVLVPGCGSIGSFRIVRDGVAIDLLRPAPTDAIAAAEPLGMGCFPLVPFSGGVWDGSFPFAGRTVALARNHPREPLPIHGDGWISAWDVAARTADSATLTLDRDGRSGFPFPYRARLDFRVDASGLEARIAVTNTGSAPMPAGVGLHPYFPKTGDVELEVRNTRVWPDRGEPDADGAVATPAEWDFTHTRPIRGVVVDRCFAGWDRRATVSWPGRGVTLDMRATAPLDHVVIFMPPGQDYFCVEPVSNADDGFNRMARGCPGHGATVLPPGGTLSGGMRLTVRRD